MFERAERYSGNIRAYVARKQVFPVAPAVGELLALEERVGLHTPQVWNEFRSRVHCQSRQVHGVRLPGTS